MAAAALPIALLAGVVAELVSGLVGWPLGGDRAWWRRVTGIWPDLLRLTGRRERVTVYEASGALAALFGAGMAAAGAMGLGPGDLPLLYLALVVAAAGGMLAESGTQAADGARLSAVRTLAEPAFAVGLGTMFLRYGSLELQAVRETQGVLGTGLLLTPGLALAGLIAAALAVIGAGAMRLSSIPAAPRRGRATPAGGSLVLIRLCRWSLAGATSLVAAVLLVGGGLEPFRVDGLLPVAAGALGAAVVLGAADALLGRLSGGWRLLAAGAAVLVAGSAAATVVLA